jgi:hypothetical protein
MSYDNLFHGGKNLAGTLVNNHTQWRIQAENLLPDRNIFQNMATKFFPLGAIAESRDGRRWRYCEAGGTNLTKALINSGADGTANWVNEVQTYGVASAIGDKTIDVNMSTTATAGDFIDGYLVIQDGTGEGEMYIIKDNTTGVADATSGYDITIHIADEGGIRTATAITSEITVVKNLYKDVVVAATNAVAAPIGVNHVAVTANYFFWAQTRGPCAIVQDADTIVAGDAVMASQNTAGNVGLLDGGVTDVQVGRCMEVAASTETALIDLRLE